MLVLLFPGLTAGTSYQFQVTAVNSSDSTTSSSSSPTPPPTQSPPHYAVIDLGPNFQPVAVNNNGNVLGASGQFWHAGTTTQLPLPPEFPFVAPYSGTQNPLRVGLSLIPR